MFCKPKNETLIDHICRDKRVEDYNFCQKTFHSHITCPATDIYGLTKITIGRTYNLASYVYSNILHLLEQTTDPSTKKKLEKCRDGYNVVILQFELVARK